MAVRADSGSKAALRLSERAQALDRDGVLGLDLEPGPRAPSWPVASGEAFGHDAFQTDPAGLGEQSRARTDQPFGEDEVGIVDGSALLRENEEEQPASLNMKSGDKVGKELAVANKMDHDVMTTVAVEVIEDTGLCSGLTGALYTVEAPLSELLVDASLLSFNGGLTEQWAKLPPNSMKRLQLLTWVTEETADEHQGQSCTIEQLVMTIHLDQPAE